MWHDPTKYDPIRHGPPYMPTKLAKTARETARKTASSRVNPKTAQRLMGGAAPLSAVLAVLRAASFLHQTHHWQTQGPSYYADHLLFDRLYNDSQPFIDQVAERAVGIGHADLVNPVEQLRQVSQIIGVLAVPSEGEASNLVESSLSMESLVLSVVDEAMKVLEASDALTPGVDNLLQGVSDLHETFVYLLQQRAAPAAYNYAR